MSYRARVRALTRCGPLVVVLAVLASLLTTTLVSAAEPLHRVNFQPSSTAVPSGYVADTGQPWSADRGYGWVHQHDSTPVDLTANTRLRTSTEPRLSTLLQMQQKNWTTGEVTGGRWEHALPSGDYDVTVSVGDGGKNSAGEFCCLDSTHRLTVEGVLAVADFVPTAAQPHASATVTVRVADGRLTVDAAGGINTKINYIDIAPGSGAPSPTTPQVTGVTPAAGAQQVALNAAVSLTVTAPVDPASLGTTSLRLLTPAGVLVEGNYNSDAAGGTASFTPAQNLVATTTYTVQVTDQLRSTDGKQFAPFSSTFTTGSTAPQLSPYGFTKRASTPVAKPSVLALGPDGKLYVGTASGELVRFGRRSDGTLEGRESITPFGTRLITGLAFDPKVAGKLWITHNVLEFQNAPRFSGTISTLTVPAGEPLSSATSSAQDVIIGLPRSAHDHMTNGLAFGPDGKLYIAQGANTAYGDTDAYWGPRAESPLSAAVLVADVHSTTAFPTGKTINVNTDPVGTAMDEGSAPAVAYDPAAAGAPVKVHASGVRNAYSLVWATNGSLYAPVNESAAGGSTPAGPNSSPPAVHDVQAYADYFTRIDAGKYYGHPNPSAGHYALNGGNPTSGSDPWEVTEYPVGVSPDARWRAPDLSLGVHRSPNGSVQYGSSTAFAGGLKGAVLVTEYSNGDDLAAITLDSTGKPVSRAILADATQSDQALIFNNPLGVTTDPVSGVVYVAEYEEETNPSAGSLTVLSPGKDAPSATESVRFNFQPATSTTPTGYAADSGAPFDGTTGWQDGSGAPLDLTANTRVRRSAASPDSRYDTLIHMQAPEGSGNTTPGRWVTSLADGTYDVTATVGDPQALNSVHHLRAQPGTADAVTLVDKYVPTTAAPWSTQTRRVKVSNGRLVLDAVGGTNTKLAFVDIVPATAVDTTAPTASVALTGPQSTTGSSTYTGPVQVSIKATDDVGVQSLSYVLDGGAATPYTGAFSVSAGGTHTVAVTAKDAAGNVGTASATFTIAAATSVRVNFQTASSSTPADHLPDHGQAYDATRGYGWLDATTGTPASLVGNGRERDSSLAPDQRYDTFLQMQQLTADYGGVTTKGRWEHALANGTYDVTVAVGDPTATNSVHRITAEPGSASPVVLVDSFAPTSTQLFATATRRVEVADGRLTLDATGGSNTKLSFVTAKPVTTTTDTTAPTAKIALSGTLASDGSYTGNVTATVSSADETGGSGVASVQFSLDGAAAQPYTAPVTVTTTGSHTLRVTVVDGAGNTGSATSTWTQTAATTTGTPVLAASSPDDAVLGLPNPRLVFSAVRGIAGPPARAFTLRNSGTAPLTVTGLAIGGEHASSWRLDDGQPTSLTVPAGGSAAVRVLFRPTDPTGCPTSEQPNLIGDQNRNATLVFQTDDPAQPTRSLDLSGVHACYYEGNNEPVLDQIVQALGYTTKVVGTGVDRRYMGPLRYKAGSDEVAVPYFVAADPSKPVRLAPVAHYGGRNTSGSYRRTGWLPKGLSLGSGNSCSSNCRQLWDFPADTTTTYSEQQKLMPVPTGGTTFSPTTPFSPYSGDFGDVNFSDDSLNLAKDTSYATISPAHALHSFRIYPVYGPNRVRVPDTWLIGVDITRVPAYKNNDFQDLVLVLHNAKPAVGTAVAPGAAGTTVDLTAPGGTVSSTCKVTGFDGVMPNTAGNQCDPSKISFGSTGLTLTSTTGQLADGKQQNALYKSFDATRGQFTVRARVVGPVDQLTENYQQIAAFVGPDQENFVKVEAEHNGNGGVDPHLTMFYREKGVAGTVGEVYLPELKTAKTVDLVLRGNADVPDPIASSSDTHKVRGYPLAQLTAYYSIDGGPLVQVGTVKSPSDLASWFSTSAKAGVLVSGAGSTLPFSATFSRFSITRD